MSRRSEFTVEQRREAVLALLRREEPAAQLPRWIGRVLAPKQGTTRSRNCTRVHLEVLEDRCVPANHAPVGTAATLTIPQNMPYTLATTDFGFTDPNDLPANNLSAVKITTLPTVGYLANNGMPVGAGQSVSVADIAANHLVYSPDLNQARHEDR